MIQSIRTMTASFTPSANFNTAFFLSSSTSVMAAPKRMVKMISGSRSISAAAWTGFRGIISSSVSTTDGFSAASVTASPASCSYWADSRAWVSGSTPLPGLTTLESVIPMVTAIAVVVR